MGIILGALGGAGDALEKVGARNQEAQIKQDQMTLESGLAQQRTEALEVFKNNLAVNTANQQREAQTARIGAAQTGIVNSALGTKYGSSDAAVAAADAGQTDAPLTDEQRGVINQAKQADRQKLMDDPNTFTKAAIQTGDISPKDAMNNTSKLDINQLKMDNLLARAEDKNATAKEVADIRAEALKSGYELRLQAAQEKNANGKIDTATGRMLITSEDANIKAATSQMNMLNTQLGNTRPTKDGKPNPEYEGIKSQMEDLRSSIKESQTNKVAYLKSMNVMPGDGTAAPSANGRPGVNGTGLNGDAQGQIDVMMQELNDPKTAEADKPAIQREIDRVRASSSNPPASASPVAAPKPLAALPPGALQIGTSGGKPVYRTPDGKQFISQ